MPVEIERKFLVKNNYPRVNGNIYRQGYFPTENGITVRVRIAGSTSYITIKGPATGISRKEYEYSIPLADANELLSFCTSHIEKIRYHIQHDNLVWEVDEFKAENEGLVVAEVELHRADQTITLPSWVGEEVSSDLRYTNFALSKNPFRFWR